MESFREGAEARQPRDQLGDTRQQLLELDDRGDLAAKLEQRREEFRVGGRSNGLELAHAGGRRRARSNGDVRIILGASPT